MRTLDAVSGRRSCFGIVVLIVLGVVPCRSAGVYSTTDPVPGPAVATGKSEPAPLPFDLMRDDLVDRQLLLAALETTPAQRASNQKKLLGAAQERIEPLTAKVAKGAASPEDLLNLSAAYISLGQKEKAIGVLQPFAQRYREDRDLADRDPLRPLIHANLAAAYQMNGDPSLAASHLSEALDCWPEADLPGYKLDQLKWYKKVERLQRRLCVLRAAEQSKGGGKPETTGLDPLFDGVQFVGEDGQYTPGGIAEEQRKKLPADALAQVQQLVLWLPGDSRLFWLYGELLNARGDSKEAFKVLEECVGPRSMGSPELRAHRLALLPPTPPPPPTNWRFILVGGGAGLAVLVLLYLQLREFARRRRANSTQG